MIEKAYAQIKGGYERLQGSIENVDTAGASSHIMRALLGSAYQDRSVPNPKGKEELLRGRIEKAGAEKNPLTASSLRQAHAYSVLGVVEVDGKPMVKLRDPTGEPHPMEFFAPQIGPGGQVQPTPDAQLIRQEGGIVLIPLEHFNSDAFQLQEHLIGRNPS